LFYFKAGNFYDYVVTIVVSNGTYTLKNSKGTVANARTINKIEVCN
jgi:hypothetical protein